MPAQVRLCRLGDNVKLLYFALLLAVCLAPTQEKSVAENSVDNKTKIQAVWLRGQYFDQAALAQLLETAKQVAKH